MHKLAMLIWLLIGVVLGMATHAAPQLTAPLPVWQQKLAAQAPGLSPTVLKLALTALQHASEQGIQNNRILTVIDYSLPANVKRLWVFDMTKRRLLFHTYVAHGLGSGIRLTRQFSNRRNSRASSYGVFSTERSYAGSHGIAVRLFGLDPGVNDQAARRAIVMHGAWYVEDNFIRRYGRPGRSWGCPAVPDTLIQPIVEAIRYGSLLVVYYPDPSWEQNSPFLRGTNDPSIGQVLAREMPDAAPASILFVDIDRSHHYRESKPVLVMSVSRYQQIFKQAPPLIRLLRRQLGSTEYIAVTPQELVQLGHGPQHALTAADIKQNLRWVVTEVYRDGGFYHTRLRPLANMSIVGITWSTLQSRGSVGTVELANHQHVPLVATDQFIRWIGL